MKKYRKTTTALTSSGYNLRKRIARNRRRAKLVGVVYLLGIIALAAAACLPLLVHELAPVGVMAFWKELLPKNISTSTVGGMVKVVVAGLYALMLLGVVINVFRALSKLKWLSKKTANKTFGFNRNVYGMEDLGRIFSGSFAVILVGYFLISMLCSGAEVEILMLIVLGGGVLIHLLAGFWGAKTGYYDVETEGVVEHKRLRGRVAPFIRNVFQLAAVFGIMYFFLQVNDSQALITPLLEKGGVNALLNKEMLKMIAIVLQLVSVLCLFVLAKHATAITEFNFEGPNGDGMKNFRVFSFFICAMAAASAFLGESTVKTNMLIIAGIAFVAFVIELIMRKRPKLPTDKKEKKVKDDGEMTFESLPQPQDDPVEETPKKAKKVKEKKVKAKYRSKSESVAPAQAAAVAATTAAYAASSQQPVSYPSVGQPAGAYAPQVQVQPVPYPQVQPIILPQPYPQPYYQAPAQPSMACMNVVPACTVKTEEKVEAVEEKEEPALLGSGEKHEVNCPYCNKLLRITTSIPYHCCPSCDKIFPVRVTTVTTDKKMSKKEAKKAKKADKKSKK